MYLQLSLHNINKMERLKIIDIKKKDGNLGNNHIVGLAQGNYWPSKVTCKIYKCFIGNSSSGTTKNTNVDKR